MIDSVLQVERKEIASKWMSLGTGDKSIYPWSLNQFGNLDSLDQFQLFAAEYLYVDKELSQLSLLEKNQIQKNHFTQALLAADLSSETAKATAATPRKASSSFMDSIST